MSRDVRGTKMQGGLGGEWIFRQAFFDESIVRKDGTFSLPISYDDITKVEYLRIFVEPKYGHKRGKIINETYGEKFEHVEGDLVKPISEYSDTQMIELRIPLKHEYEETPDEVDVTLDGDEMKFILSDEILFDFNKSEVKPEGKRVIEEVAKWLENEAYHGLIKIYGHTDNEGTDEINQPLSEDRAQNVYDELLSHLSDLSAYEFEVKGFGKYEPIATNETSEGRQRNRRVEIIFHVNNN